jgi:hypothetical protein
MLLRINKNVRNPIFREDTTITNPERNVSGIGPGSKDAGVETLAQPTETPGILPHQFQASIVIPQIANYIVDLKNLADRINEYSKSDLASESKKVVSQKLIERINKINAIFAQDIIKYLDKLSF